MKKRPEPGDHRDLLIVAGTLIGAIILGIGITLGTLQLAGC